ncbi:MAG: hypothetical protein ACRDRO_14000 [Pseudonocardiaceae bacterium]
MLSQRNAVIALVASAALVLVLAGMSTGMFTPQSPPSPVGQSVSVHQGVPVTAPVTPAVPAPVAPAPAVPVPAAPAHHDLAAPAAAAVPSEPVVHYRQVQAPVQQQPAPAAHAPVSVEPAQNPRPASPPPSSALPARDTKSRSVNTEPCACDGTMRRVPTHWDPPQS